MSMEKDFAWLAEHGAKEKVICKLCGKYKVNAGFKVCKKCAEKLKKERMTIKQIAKKLNKPEKEFGYRLDGRIEWHCKHGVGHTVWSPHKDKYAFVHGCDGCCKDLEAIE